MAFQMNKLVKLEEINRLRGIIAAQLQCLSTSSIAQKRRPKTVGIPAWARATDHRQEFLAKLNKQKSEEQIKAERRLDQMEESLHFWISGRHSDPKGLQTEADTISRPQLFFTKGSKNLISYHPPRPYPIAFTKPCVQDHWWFVSSEDSVGYCDTLTDEQRSEAISLRNSSPTLWTVRYLCHLLKVKPAALRDVVRLTKMQEKELEVERKLLDNWPKVKRDKYRQLQGLERIQYAEKTRRDEEVKELQSKLMARPLKTHATKHHGRRMRYY